MKYRKLYWVFALCTQLLVACGNNQSLKMATSRLDSVSLALANCSKANDQLELNKKIVADFYQEVFGNKNVAAIDAYVADEYIQHNPVLADGKTALKTALTAWYKGAPREKIDIHHLSGEDDLVYMHTKGTEGGKTVSIIDIFRLKNNLIVEHWDVIQVVPDKSANPHPMF